MASSKGPCDDLVEGKFSFPIVHALNTYLAEPKRLQKGYENLCSPAKSDIGVTESHCATPNTQPTPARQQLLAQLNARPTCPSQQAAIVAQLEEGGSFAYTRDIVEALCSEIQDMMLRVGIDDKAVRALLGRLVLVENYGEETELET